jgi:CRISPR-associated protein Cas1
VKTVYVAQRGATLRREGALLQVWVNRRKEADVSVYGLEQVVLMGNVMVTPGALDLMIERGIDTVFLTLHGKYRARLVHGVSANVRLRVAQYRKLSEPAEALSVARAIVGGKVRNSLTFLQRFARRHGGTERLAAGMAGLRATLLRLERCEDVEEVRGCEGAGAAAYFRCFGDLVRADGFAFDGRNRRPPMDPVNALLSLAYTLLANAVESAVHIVGLDPYVGALHAIETGRPSLVCDLMEEYRALIADPLVIAAVNRGAMQVDDFEDVGPGEPVLIRREALARFVGLFERRLQEQILYPPTGVRLTFRQVMEQQARRFARFIQGTEAEYVAFWGK